MIVQVRCAKVELNLAWTSPPNSLPQPPRPQMKAQDSPRTSPSPPPLAGLQAETEQELIGLANALYNLGTTVITDSSKDRSKTNPESSHVEGKPVGNRVNEVIDRLAALEDFSQKTTIMIPMQILQSVNCCLSFAVSLRRSTETSTTPKTR